MKKRWIAVIAMGIVILLILAGSDNNNTGNSISDTPPEYTNTCSLILLNCWRYFPMKPGKLV